MTAPPMRGAVQAMMADPAAARSRDFTGSARRLFRRLSPQRTAIAAVLALSIGSIVLSAIGPRVLGHATDLLFNGVIGRTLPSGITREQAIAAAQARGDNTFADLLSGMNVTPGRGVDFDAVGRTLLLALAMYLVAALLIWSQARLLNVIVARTITELRSEVERKVHRLPLSYFDSRQRGELLSRVTNDVDNIQASVSITISQLFTAVLTVIAVSIMMLTISPLLALITVCTVPLSLWVTRAIARRSQKLFVAQWANTGRLNAHIEETYSGFTVVRTFGHRASAQDRFGELNAEVYTASFGAQFFSGLVSPATMFVGNLSYVAVAVIGGFQVASGQITLGSVQAFIQYVRQFNQPLTQVAGMYNTLQSGVASAERVFDFLDEPEESDSASTEVPRGRGQVVFQNVSFGYAPEAAVIEDLTLAAEPGSTVAIVGPTGAGKTTLVNLLMRFYDPTEGKILFDGHDLKEYSTKDLLAQMALVSQDVVLFNLPVGINIGFGRENPTQQEIEQAAKHAYAHDFIMQMPSGYDSPCGERGQLLSGGQKARVAIARAFVRNAPILVLDEPTAALDSRAEKEIQTAIDSLEEGRTVICIAHRLSTLANMDEIIVLDHGRIVERGTFEELLKAKGHFAKMAEQQRLTAAS